MPGSRIIHILVEQILIPTLWLWLALYAKHFSLSGSSEPLDPPTKGPVLAPNTRSGLQLCLTIKTLSPLNMCRKSSDFIKLNISRSRLNVLESSHGVETLIIQIFLHTIHSTVTSSVSVQLQTHTLILKKNILVCPLYILKFPSLDELFLKYPA